MTYTVDALAQAAGLPTSTIRLYRQRGLLMAPRMEGRVGYYGDEHVARLRVIADLQARGYSLAAIKELVQGWESGRDLQAVLGLGEQSEERVDETMTAGELAVRVAGADDPVLLGRMRALGIVADSGDGRLVVNGDFLRVVPLLGSLGLTLRAMLDEFAPVDAFAKKTAARFVALFEDFVLRNAAAVDIDAVAGLVPVLRTVAGEIVSGALARAIDEAAEEAVARYRPAL